jgi:hypothetical protein
VTRPKLPKKRLEFELAEGAPFSERELDLLVDLIAQAIHGKLEKERTMNSLGDRCGSSSGKSDSV